MFPTGMGQVSQVHVAPPLIHCHPACHPRHGAAHCLFPLPLHEQHPQACATFTRRHPWSVVIPLATLAIFLTIMVLLTVLLSNNLAEQRRKTALFEAKCRADVVSEVLLRAAVPVNGLVNYVAQTPGYDWGAAKQVRVLRFFAR